MTRYVDIPQNKVVENIVEIPKIEIVEKEIIKEVKVDIIKEVPKEV